MSQNNTFHLAQEFLDALSRSAEPADIANLFSENVDWKFAGDTNALPWIGQKSGRAAIIDFLTQSRALIDRISFEISDVLANERRAVILGSLASEVKRTGKVVKTDFAIILTVNGGEIVCFQMLEDSFAVSQATHP